MRIFYTPTHANELFASKMRKMGALPMCEFIRLPERKQARISRLKSIEGSAVFLGGDGYSHGESYFFTLSEALKLKINVDRHADNRRFWKKLNCANHMRYSRLAGMEIVTPEDERISSRRAALSRAKSRVGKYGEKEIAVTVDCDAISCFPAVRRFASYDGFLAQEPLALILEAGSRVGRLDVSGMRNFQGDFKFTYSLSPPSQSKVDEVVRRNGAPSAKMADEVLSYAFSVYHAFISAFAAIEK